MIIGIGIDIVQNSRIKQSLADHSINFIKKILTKKEIKELSKNEITHIQLAGIFAAKEAIIKSLSAFLGFSLNFQDITLSKYNDVPKAIIINKIAQSKLSSVKVVISISHEKYYSIALSVAEII